MLIMQVYGAKQETCVEVWRTQPSDVWLFERQLMDDTLGALDTRGLSRRQLVTLAALAAGAVPLSACGDDRRRRTTNPAATTQAVDSERPENKAYPYDEAERLFKSLQWPRTNVPEPRSKVTVTMAITVDENAQVRHQQFAKFLRELHPNIEIKREVTPFVDYLTKYVTQAAGGSLPDLMYCHYSWARNFIKNNILAPLDDLVAATPEFNQGDFTPTALGFFRNDGKLYGVPTDSAPKMLYYNKEIFDKAGIAPPDKTWTWSKVQAVARELTQGDGVNKQFGYTPMPVPFADLSTMYLMPYGGRFLSPDETTVMIGQPAAHDALAPWVDLQLKAKAVPSLAELQALENADPFRAKHAAMAANGVWIIPALQRLPDHQKFRWGLTHLPSGPAGRFSPAVGSAFGITTRSGNKEAAWIVLNAFLSAAGHRFFMFTPPSRLSTFEANLQALKVDERIIADSKESLQAYGTGDGVLRLPNTQKVIDTANPIWDRVRSGKQPLADGLREIAERCAPVAKGNVG
jgi:multiple sugar transport system substrate-binding protein